MDAGGVLRAPRSLTVAEIADMVSAHTRGWLEPGRTAFCQLSSGSTGKSKAIQVTHRGVLSHARAMQMRLGYRADRDVSLNWLPLDHVGAMLMYNLAFVCDGCGQVQVTPSHVLTEPLRWLDLMSTHGVTTSWAPNFAFKLVAERVAEESKASGEWAARLGKLKLSGVRRLLCGGEQVTMAVATAFLDALRPFGIVDTRVFMPAYGSAETCTGITHMVDFGPDTGVWSFDKASLKGVLRDATAETSKVNVVNFVPVGEPNAGVELRIVDHANQLLTERRIGRLQVRGDVITPGYVGNEAANAEAFVSGDGWYTTGDLAVAVNGAVAITGREKEMVNIHGANFYCYEIEDSMATLPELLPTFQAACPITDDQTGSESLALFFVVRRTFLYEADGDTPRAGVHVFDVIPKIRQHIARNFGVSTPFVIPLTESSFPKTTSGKIQRSKLSGMCVASCRIARLLSL